MAEKHTHHHDYAKANAEHFNERAQTYRNEFSIELAKRCSANILKRYSFDSNKTEVLDFACGPGLIALELLSHAKRIVGADNSQGMVDVFNRDVEQQGISLEKLHCMKIDSLKGDSSDLDGLLFDVIICVQAYHHFEDPLQMTRVLAQRLKPKGRLMIIDFIDDENQDKLFSHTHTHKDQHDHVVAHRHGFSSEQMMNMFKAANLQNSQVEAAFKIPKSEMETYQGHEVFSKRIDNSVDFSLNYFIAYADKD